MSTELLKWLGTNAAALGILGALLLFIIFGWRHQQLELEKLRLEVKKLREENRIYRPTQAEIEAVLKKCAKLPSVKLGFTGPEPTALEAFSQDFSTFLLHLSVYHGNLKARSLIAERRLYDAMQGKPDPYPAWEVTHPDYKRIVSLWQQAREQAERKLEASVISDIDLFLARFSHATDA